MTMKTTKGFLSALCGAACCAAFAAEMPEVTAVSLSQEDSREATISYTLAHAPAIVTLDIQTNVSGDVWASIGGENIQVLSGDVNRRIATDGEHVIKWRPDLSCRKRRRTLGQWRVDQLQCARTVQWKWWRRQRCGNRDGGEGNGHRRQLCAERLGPL